MGRLLASVAGLPARSKALAAGLLVAAIAAAGIAYALGRDARVPLFVEPLRAEQVSEVVERLAAWNVPFVALADNVRVDASRRNDLLLRLSLAGVPHAHVVSSAEALEKAGPLTPQAVLDAEQRAGLAGDLELALRGVAGIEDARVILAPGRPATFADEPPTPTSASVRLTLRSGAAPPRDLLAGVRTFVASAVPGLDPKRVVLLDDRGISLGDESASGDLGTQLETSLQSALDLAFGADATIVRVRVARDARTREVHDVRREPLGGRAIVAATSDERYANEKKRFTRTRADEERGSAVHDERVAVAPGATERISVAILVDAARALDLVKIRELASAAAGLEPQRGDAISVQAVAFRRPSRPVHALAYTALGYAATFAPAGFAIVGVLLAVRWCARPLGTALAARATAHRATATVAGLAPADVRLRLRGEPPYVVAAVLSELPTPVAAAVLEAYPAAERGEIVRRMATTLPPAARSLLRES